VKNYRYPFLPRIRTLGAILEKIRPEPAREPLPPRHRVRGGAYSFGVLVANSGL